ncbi:LAFE_0E07382g1_1 [Lachancea fermentati]|uniref:LAFE_0E07382g1_1 n=1 Tax=Lachancea fermentati TaxID=4955 RepID=A0A1G4MD00_LACFM|nr:LAFE_0E07382g1_1 [Lachancea fermentati]
MPLYGLPVEHIKTSPPGNTPSDTSLSRLLGHAVSLLRERLEGKPDFRGSEGLRPDTRRQPTEINGRPSHDFARSKSRGPRTNVTMTSPLLCAVTKHDTRCSATQRDANPTSTWPRALLSVQGRQCSRLRLRLRLRRVASVPRRVASRRMNVATWQRELTTTRKKMGGPHVTAPLPGLCAEHPSTLLFLSPARLFQNAWPAAPPQNATHNACCETVYYKRCTGQRR